MAKSPADQIRDIENTLTAKRQQIKDILEKSAEAGTTLDDEQADQVEELRGEIKTLSRDLGFWKDFQGADIAKATEIKSEGDNPERRQSELRGAPTVLKNREPEEQFPGQFFTQRVKAKTIAKLEGRPASAVAYDMFVRNARPGQQNQRLVDVIKANEVAGGGETTGEWGAELVQADTRYTGDFINYLYSMTVYDKLPLREVPANVAIKGQDGASTAYWIGEAKAGKATTADFSTVNLTPLKVVALTAISKELIRDSSPAADMLVRDSLVQAIAQRVDTTFLSNSAASPGVSPAGMLNGVSAITSAGTTADDLRYDINALYAPFITAKNATGLQFVMQPSLAKAISLLRNALGQVEFPGLNAGGGVLEGDQVVTGDNVGSGDLILLKPSDIYRIGDTGIDVSMSDQATLEMSTAPTGDAFTPTAASENLQNMFQQEMVAFKVVRSINFAKRRSHAVQYVGDAAYAPSSS